MFITMRTTGKGDIMKNIRIILISVLTILVGNIALSYFRNSLQQEYIAKTEYGKVDIKIEPSGLMPELDSKEECYQKSQLDISFDLLGYSKTRNSNRQAFTGALMQEIEFDIWQHMIEVLPSEIYPGVYEARDGGNLLGYWGAKGYSETSASDVGKFSNNIVRRVRWNPEQYDCYDLYDRQSKTIHSLQALKTKGDSGETQYDIKAISDIKLPDKIDMVDFANLYLSESDIILTENFGNTWLDSRYGFMPAMRPATEEEITSESYNEYYNSTKSQNKIIVDASAKNCRYSSHDFYCKMRFYDNAGQVYEVDEDTREISPLCKLPVSDVRNLGKDNYLCVFSKISRDRYDSLAKDQSKLLDVEPIGYFYASYSKDNEVSVTVYNKEGKVIASESKDSHSKYLTNNHEGLWLARTVVENMPGPAIAAASYFARDITEPMKQWQTLFLMPGSIANYSTMIKDGNPLEYINHIGLCVYLTGGVLVYYLFNVKRYGLSERERKYWLYVILLFGVMGFAAYMISRPKIVQVTCGNCGKLRRPDQERCHSCRASWDMPQLEKVGWEIK